MRTAVRAQRVVVDDEIRPAAVLIEDGRIVDVVAPGDVPEGVGIQDVGDHVLMPGLVDAHVHINEPGRTQWEGFTTATRAAASGGVTCVVDMPLNCIPVTTNADALQAKLDACAGSLWVDAGFWGGVVPDNAADLGELAKAGVLGAKAFMIDSGIPEFEWCPEPALREGMLRLKELGIPLLAHAELDLGADATGDPRTYAAYLGSRPPAWEDAAIALLIALCRETGCAVHVVHLSSASAIDLVRAARSEGLPVTAETCAHYLCFAAEDIPDGATQFKCAPPIRGRDNREQLWAALQEGVIDFIVTDHSPCTPSLKLPERGDFIEAWGGVASLSLGLGSVWAQARARGVELPTLVRWLSTGPARFAGLSDRKGRIAPGLDADLVAWDPDETHEARVEDLHFRHKISPYLGHGLAGRVHATWVRGQPVYRDGTFAEQPIGRPVLGRVTPTT